MQKSEGIFYPWSLLSSKRAIEVKQCKQLSVIAACIMCGERYLLLLISSLIKLCEINCPRHIANCTGRKRDVSWSKSCIPARTVNFTLNLVL